MPLSRNTLKLMHELAVQALVRDQGIPRGLPELSDHIDLQRRSGVLEGPGVHYAGCNPAFAQDAGLSDPPS